MTYLLAYLGIGLVILVIVLVAKWIGDRRETIDDAYLRDLRERRQPSWKEWLIDDVIGSTIAGVLVIVAWPLVVVLWVKEKWFSGRASASERPVFEVRQEHLLERRSIEEIERLERVDDPLDAVPDLPFGHLHFAWLQFREKLEPGDEVWSFTAPWSEWGWCYTRSGYAILRKDGVGPWFISEIRPGGNEE